MNSAVMSRKDDTVSYEERLKQALELADPMALRGLLYQLTGDETLHETRMSTTPGLFTGEVVAITDPEELAALRAKTLAACLAYRAGTLKPPQLTPEHLRTAMCLALADEIPQADAEFWIEEIAVTPWLRGLRWDGGEPRAEAREGFKVLLIGAGLGGVNAAIQLKRAKVPFVWLEKNAGAGGTWYQNNYPGARVDVPSRAYSHTWAVNYPFTHTFVPQGENERYINWAVDEFGVRSDLQTNTEVISLVWDDRRRLWKVGARTKDGGLKSFEVNAVIAGVGFLDRPVIPAIDGVDTFQGPAFHTARWDHSVDLRGKRIAVIGTGASALQVIPEVAPLVEKLTVFQRTPAWIIPMQGYRDPLPEDAMWLNQNVPFYNNWARLRVAWQVSHKAFVEVLNRDPAWTGELSISAASEAVLQLLTSHIQSQLADRPDLVKKCLPTYPPLAKRWVVDNGWFDALKRDNVELVTDGVIRVEKDGVVSAGDVHHPADVIVYGTGFHANDYLWPMEVVGRDGLAIGDRWAKDGARAYHGVMVPGFPNFFMLYGPNTNAFANGPVVWGELQTRYALEWIKEMIGGGIEMADVTEKAYDEFNERLDERLSTSVFLDRRVKGYYTNDFGRVATNGPWSTEEYWHALRRPNFGHFEIIRRPT